MGIVTTDIKVAASTLAAGGLCAIPTETVYGLAADASNVDAIREVFSAKGRPADHPLIVHVGDVKDIGDWIESLPDWATSLIQEYMPGPLTIVGYRTSNVRDEVTGGQNTVAVRVPSHPIAHDLLVACRKLGVAGLVAPSANLFGHVSPTTAKHVEHDLGDYLKGHDGLILDGGASSIGVESTIVLATGPTPVVLRPGGVTRKNIEEATGLSVSEKQSDAPRVSGALDSHYSPVAQVVVVTEVPSVATNCGVIAFSEIATPTDAVRLASPTSVEDFARDLYRALRSADDQHLDTVYVVCPTEDGLAEAIRDRIRRAAFPKTSAKA